ncbi:hypothetical protein [Arthrobacter sp. ISL-28]|uniref:hypothetical protein n=1 Tax=Arthrobacter sp. ISL-28 TaxID=2819108 RepID=UPI001BE5A0F0|nr:hypothetical protein [Arthrobacter sp. ISL-28]MBT2521729.1 hypothetical protein [Arthrobacter sp. ISL-28]
MTVLITVGVLVSASAAPWWGTISLGNLQELSQLHRSRPSQTIAGAQFIWLAVPTGAVDL